MPAIDVQIVLDLVLAGTVRVEGVDGVILIGGYIFRLAIDSTPRGGVDDFPHLVVTCGLQDVQRAEDVDLGVEHGPDHRFAHVGFGGLVRNHLGLFLREYGLQSSLIANVDLIETCTRVHVFTVARGKVIHNADIVSRRQHRVDDVRTDKPGATGHHYLHGSNTSAKAD